MTLQILPGTYAFATMLTQDFLSAVDGGGQTANAIHTDAKNPSTWETFKLWRDPNARVTTPDNPEGFFPYAIQTSNAHYLTAVGGGGRTSDVLHTDATEPLAWETFGLLPQDPSFSIYPGGFSYVDDAPWYYAIATDKGPYLTALGGGGKTQDPTMHSDATAIKTWELFRLFCSGELLPNYQYSLRPLTGYSLFAVNGGGRPVQGVILASPNDQAKKVFAKFTLIAQKDGSFALQTLSGNYVTAVAGGGVGPYRSDGITENDVFHADAVKVGTWEQFKIIDQGDFTYILQTHFGWYVGAVDDAFLRTDITDAKSALKFRLTPYLSEN